MFDVLIPARNEGTTIFKVVSTFRRVRKINHVFVALDGATTDDTSHQASLAGAEIIDRFTFGKGQTVTAAARDISTAQVILCDGDYTGLSYWHIRRMCAYAKTAIQLIGVPDIPPNYPHDKEGAWPWVSGIRRVPTAVIRFEPFHGYLMEVQINEICRRAHIPTMTTNLRGLVSPYEMTEQRRTERDRDLAWGIKNGVLPKPAKTSNIYRMPDYPEPGQ